MALNERGTRADSGRERDAAIDRAYAAAPLEEPPAALDAAILAAAHREVHARPRPAASYARRWQVPVSIAAVVVLSATLLVQMRNEGLDRLDDRGLREQESLSRLERTPDAMTARNVPGTPVPAEAPSADTVGSRMRRDAAVSGSADREQAARQEERLPAPAAARESPTSAETRHFQFEPAARDAVPAANVAGQPAEPAPKAVARKEDSAPLAAPDAVRRAGVLAPTAPGGAAPLQAEADQQARRTAEAAAARASADANPAPASPPAAKAAPAAPRSAPFGALASRIAPWEGLEQAPPERWIERMESLRRDGHEDLFQATLKEFQRRFPGHPLPPSLAR